MKYIFDSRKYSLLILAVLFTIFVTYAYLLSFKRYANFEFGKFDLGNMAQMVSNTKNGRFMELTDQFGSNMPRWGMSHVDPIVLLFVPIFFIYEHPMILVFFQQILIYSAIFPLFLLTYIKTKSRILGTLVVLAYLLYPANGFSVVWTGFHGISFVAPLFAWFVYFLEKNAFLARDNLRLKIIYWLFIVVLLSGKEEIGAILALYSIFIYFKNKKLAIYTFFVTLGWTLICFLYIIPKYSDLRSLSIDRFVEEVGVEKVNIENAKGANFFLMRYSYLGSSYGEIAKNAIFKPNLVIEKSLTKDKMNALNNLFGPLGYFVVLNPIWLISLPDILIVFLSSDEIFEISNHRIAFVIITLFISYVYFLGFLNSRLKLKQKNQVLVFYAFLVILLNFYFSSTTRNPMYISMKSFVFEKIVAKVFAAGSEDLQIGDIRRGKIPRNNKFCYDKMYSFIEKYDPNIYTGPDYLGAHASLRYVNALFPSRITDSDLVIADVFETKAVDPLDLDEWIFNKEAMRKMIDAKRYRHIESCSMMHAFVNSDQMKVDNIEVVNSSQNFSVDYRLHTKKFGLTLFDIKYPNEVDKNSASLFEVTIRKDFGDFDDHTVYWVFEPLDSGLPKHAFVDYLIIADRNGFDTIDFGTIIKEVIDFDFVREYTSGEYRVYYGVGDLLESNEIYVGNIVIN